MNYISSLLAHRKCPLALCMWIQTFGNLMLCSLISLQKFIERDNRINCCPSHTQINTVGISLTVKCSVYVHNQYNPQIIK